MTKEPLADPVPPDVPPLESITPGAPADETVPAGIGSARNGAESAKPVMIGRPRTPGKLSRRLVTAYFAGGLALLLAGTVAVFYLAFEVYGGAGSETVTIGRGTPAPVPSREVPSRVEPSEPLLERIGPQRLANGAKFVIQGERGAKFEVTVRARKPRRTACDAYGSKPKGSYLPTELRVKVLAGEPDVSQYDFQFQRPDGTRLNAAYGSNCDKDYGAFVRRLVAGRTYRTTIVFDVPSTKGDIVFVYPVIDVIASWHLG